MIPTDLPEAVTSRAAAVVPSDLAAALEAAPEALHYFESLSYGRQRRFVRNVEDATTAEARRRRIASAIERLRTEGGVPRHGILASHGGDARRAPARRRRSAFE
jgi:uncharacterized protein YdeI (YjbR/CyaY-like superfamily)